MRQLALLLVMVVTLTSCQTATDPQISKDVIRTVRSYNMGKAEDILHMMCATGASMTLNNARAEWRAFSDDPNQDVWTVECYAIGESVTSSGVATKEALIYKFLYEIPTGRLYIEDLSLAKGMFKGGAPDLDIGTNPPSLRIPFKRTQDGVEEEQDS